MDEQNKPETPVGQQIPTQPAAPITPAEVPTEVQQEPQQIAQPTAPTQVYVPRKTDTAEVKPSRMQKFKDFVTECTRVIRVTKKPDRTEFKTIVKISGIGMAIVGFLGFFVHFVKELFF